MKHKKQCADPVARVRGIAAKGRPAHAALREASLALCEDYVRIEYQLLRAREELAQQTRQPITVLPLVLTQPIQ